jgi:3-oxoacyl-[acyl-carrier-protein] synthase III
MLKHGCSIVGIGAYVPDRIVTNVDIAKPVDTNDAWIVARTGIRERRIAREDEFTSDLGAKPAERALLHARALTWSFHWIHRCLMSHPQPERHGFLFW